MTKRELDGRMANMIYRMTGKRYYLGDIDIVLEAFPYVIAEAIIEDETVSITGFGKFMPKHLHARDWTNPITGETKHVQDHLKIKFRPSLAFNQMLSTGVTRIESGETFDDEIDDA